MSGAVCGAQTCQRFNAATRRREGERSSLPSPAFRASFLPSAFFLRVQVCSDLFRFVQVKNFFRKNWRSPKCRLSAAGAAIHVSSTISTFIHDKKFPWRNHGAKDVAPCLDCGPCTRFVHTCTRWYTIKKFSQNSGSIFSRFQSN